MTSERSPDAVLDAATAAAPPRTSLVEIAVVLGLPTALFLASSTLWLVRGQQRLVFTDAGLLWTVALEIVMSALLLVYLWRRGWTPVSAAGAPEIRDVPRGVLVWIVAMMALSIVTALLSIAVPSWRHVVQAHRFAGSISIPVAMVVAILNSVFEEFLWLGYSVPALESRVGLRTACVISIAIRTLVHSYQGAVPLIGIGIIAIVFTGYYARSRRLWPVIVAHVITDAAGFLMLRH